MDEYMARVRIVRIDAWFRCDSQVFAHSTGACAQSGRHRTPCMHEVAKDVAYFFDMEFSNVLVMRWRLTDNASYMSHGAKRAYDLQ